MSAQEHDTATTNRLAGESSPYLLLHQHNPVDWYPWGPEALERAKREDRPIFLSVGYSTCYWCHVMERESFSNSGIAEQMNREFVNIKVDREERPDIDEIYMAATQILSGQGGWPNSVFLTPDLKPFYAGTYFPPEDRYGRPGFGSVLEGLAEAWRTRRKDVEEQAEEMEKAMRRFLEERAQPAAAPPNREVAERALDSLARRFDREWGGFGGAPKFPTPSNLYLCLEMAGERPEAGEMLAATLDQMARGGIYDQLAGGFHRYATDREWKVPHFEKMLYDNGFLLELYAREFARTGDRQAERIVRETADWIAREMTSGEGAFYSAIDAETHGHEGAYYVWTRDEIAGILGEEDATFLAPILGFDGPPFFEGTYYVLHRPERIEETANRRRMPPGDLLREAKALEAKLLAERFRRERPLTDDKILADWNGMAISGLAVAGELLGERPFVERAATAARFILDRMRPEGTLLHAWRQGQGRIAAYLSDYAFFVRGLLDLHRADGGGHWLKAAAELTEEQIRRLSDPRGGFFVAAESPDLLFRSKEVFDGATPSGNAVAVLNLLDLAERTGEGAWRSEARAALRAFAPLIESHPDAVRMLAIAVRRYHAAEEGGTHATRDVPPIGTQERIAYERLPEAAGVNRLVDEAADLVTPRLELADERDGWRPFRLSLIVEPGWHIQANPASEEYLIPTEVRAEGAQLRNVRYPEPRDLPSKISDKPLAVWDGTVEITGELGEIAPDATLNIVFQACDDFRCLPETERAVAVLPL
ncbi:MAG TPA: thioredoxin domain-containing protein [Thermoanaerobaculia bacterium]